VCAVYRQNRLVKEPKKKQKEITRNQLLLDMPENLSLFLGRLVMICDLQKLYKLSRNR